jgi:hypothetical protein
LKPAEKGGEGWTFFVLPKSASEKLPTRSMQSVDGTLNGVEFQVTLEPDGQGSHCMKVEKELSRAAGVKAGDTVKVEIEPVKEEPEPKVPADMQKARKANPKAMETWRDITAVARRDWIHWITSGKKAETRPKRIVTAVDKLQKGMRRACCFDRSGMYSNSLSCPVADSE